MQETLPFRRRPYRVECTGSLPTSEVKRRRARLVLGWGTAWEDLRVLSAFMLQPPGGRLLCFNASWGPRATHVGGRPTMTAPQIEGRPRKLEKRCRRAFCKLNGLGWGN